MKARTLSHDDYLNYWTRRVHELWRGLERDAANPPRFGLESMPKFRWVDGAQFSVREYLESAWVQGAKACGINANTEATAEEKRQLQEILDTQSQRDWLNRFYDDIKAAFNQGLVEASMQYRINMWANRWNEVHTRARVVFCADRKVRWTLGEAEHCPSCVKLSGKVKRMSYWNERGIIPRVAGADYLECHGYNCQCSLVETDEPQSKGPLPKLP